MIATSFMYFNYINNWDNQRDKGAKGYAVLISGNILFVSVETNDAFYGIYIDCWNCVRWDGITFSGKIHFENSLFNNSIINIQELNFFQIYKIFYGNGVILRGYMLFEGIETKSFIFFLNYHHTKKIKIDQMIQINLIGTNYQEDSQINSICGLEISSPNITITRSNGTTHYHILERKIIHF